MKENRGAGVGVSDVGESTRGADDVDTGLSSGAAGNVILLFTQSINGL